MNRFNWPTYFGILDQDCHWIVDGVHLTRSGLSTTAQPDWTRRKRLPRQKPCRTTWKRATIGAQFLRTTDRKKEGCNAVEPFDPNLEGDSNEALKLRRAACRVVELRRPATGKNAKPFTEQIASEAVAGHMRGTRTLIDCDTAKTVRQIFQELAARDMPRIPLTSCFRARDRREAEEILRALEAHRGTCRTEGTGGNDPGPICVRTQVVEAGLDVSAYRLVTARASRPSLIQRPGRLNRDDNGARAIVRRSSPKDDNTRKHDGEDWIGPCRRSALDRASWPLQALAPRSDRKTPVEAHPELRTRYPRNTTGAYDPAGTCPRAFYFPGLFSTEPDLHGCCTDVGRFVRNTDEKSYVFGGAVKTAKSGETGHERHAQISKDVGA